MQILLSVVGRLKSAPLITSSHAHINACCFRILSVPASPVLCELEAFWLMKHILAKMHTIQGASESRTGCLKRKFMSQLIEENLCGSLYICGITCWTSFGNGLEFSDTCGSDIQVLLPSKCAFPLSTYPTG